MPEIIVPIIIAMATGFGVFGQKIHNRITDLDKRIDGIQLRVAQEYVAKVDLAEVVDRVEQHMIRIENKLDRIVLTNSKY